MQIVSTKKAPMVKAYTRKLKEGERLGSMEPLMSGGRVRSYSQEGDTITVYSEDRGVVEQLPVVSTTGLDLKQKLVGFLRPEQMERDCSPEYVAWRKWNLVAGALNGVIGFMATSVFLDAQNASYSNSEAVALSGVITGTLGKVTHLAASPLARLGDSDPKKSYLRSHLISTATNSAALGLLGALPDWHFPVFCATSVGGTVGSAIGAAAGANIFSHLVPGPTKGDVTNKNSNQDLIASLWGMPVGFALGRAARALGLHPGVLGACLLGPLKAFCHVQAARALRMTPAGPRELAAIADSYFKQGDTAEAPAESVADTLRELFQTRQDSSEKLWPFVGSLRVAVGEDSAFTLEEFAGEKYLLSLDPEGRIAMGLAKDAKSEDALRAALHHTVLRQALDSRLPEVLKEMGRANPLQDVIRLTHRALPEPAETIALMARKGWHLAIQNFGFPLLDARWQEGEKVRATPLPVKTVRELLGANPDREMLEKLLQNP